MPDNGVARFLNGNRAGPWRRGRSRAPPWRIGKGGIYRGRRPQGATSMQGTAVGAHQLGPSNREEMDATVLFSRQDARNKSSIVSRLGIKLACRSPDGRRSPRPFCGGARPGGGRRRPVFRKPIGRRLRGGGGTLHGLDVFRTGRRPPFSARRRESSKGQTPRMPATGLMSASFLS